MGITDDETIRHNVLNEDGKLYLFSLKRDEKGYPDFDYALALYSEIEKLIASGKVMRTTVTEEGGYACAVAKGLMGDMT